MACCELRCVRAGGTISPTQGVSNQSRSTARCRPDPQQNHRDWRKVINASLSYLENLWSEALADSASPPCQSTTSSSVPAPPGRRAGSWLRYREAQGRRVACSGRLEDFRRDMAFQGPFSGLAPPVVARPLLDRRTWIVYFGNRFNNFLRQVQRVEQYCADTLMPLRHYEARTCRSLHQFLVPGDAIEYKKSTEVMNQARQQRRAGIYLWCQPGRQKAGNACCLQVVFEPSFALVGKHTGIGGSTHLGHGTGHANTARFPVRPYSTRHRTRK